MTDVDEGDIGLEWFGPDTGKLWFGFFPTKPGEVIAILTPPVPDLKPCWLPIAGPEMKAFLGHATVKKILRTAMPGWPNYPQAAFK